MDKTIDFLRAINNPIRLEILMWLKEPEKYFNLEKQLLDPVKDGVCASIIQERSGLSQSTISSYLNILLKENILITKRSGPWTYYRRNEEVIKSRLKDLETIII